MLDRLPKTVSFSALIHLYSRERKLVLILKEVKKTDRSPYSFRKNMKILFTSLGSSSLEAKARRVLICGS